jgi:hypothetical protein
MRISDRHRRVFLLVFLAALWLLCRDCSDAWAERHVIGIVAPPELLGNPVTSTAIDDVRQLLSKGFPGFRIALNDPAARLQIVLPHVPASSPTISRNVSRGSTPCLLYPDHRYEWCSTVQGGRVILKLHTASPQGVSFGLYGLLQEKLGYRFYHPKRTIIPHHARWPLPARFAWQAVPRFDKKGFHLHTLHPIELAEQLNDPAQPGALADVQEYLDWLVRNQQNVMQFYLLRGVDRERWIGHAQRIVEYAHRRGVLVGVEFSLAMLQQQAFQAVKLLRPIPSYRRQVDQTLAWLFRAPWDFVTVEPTMGEYLPHLERRMSGLVEHLTGEVRDRYHALPILATHVIRRGGEAERQEAPGAGLLLHSVMCYSVIEPNAPVYGNLNQRFVLERAARECGRRETWYWPESSYWVAFDTPVPLLLLPYLDARFSDMAAMEQCGAAGHLTFSSGWEWGYWLIDWSIARWSWRHFDNGRAVRSEPLGPLLDFFPGTRSGRLWRKALRLQNVYLKDRELLRYMSALAPFSELPWPCDKSFQPEPAFASRWLLRKASPAEVERIIRGPVAALDEYAARMEPVVAALEEENRKLSGSNEEVKALGEELTRGLRVTALRARHRSLTIRALIAARRDIPSLSSPVRLLDEAALVRGQAMEQVRRQETLYRYPATLIAGKRKSLTAYQFGYLYPASTLFFWRREEEQVRLERFDPFFMNMWDFRRTLGLESLL